MADRVADVTSVEVLKLVDGIVFRAVERAYAGALGARPLTRQSFTEMGETLRDDILIALRSVRSPSSRRSGDRE